MQLIFNKDMSINIAVSCVGVFLTNQSLALIVTHNYIGHETLQSPEIPSPTKKLNLA